MQYNRYHTQTSVMSSSLYIIYLHDSHFSFMVKNLGK